MTTFVNESASQEYPPFDLLVIGGGINGVGIARDAAGRGLKVFLCEKNDLASATSSASTKLIHGGLRYLEHYEFRLVRAALKERETLLRAAPHIIRQIRFVLPYHKSLRPAWVLRIGLAIYDHVGGRKNLPPTKSIDLKSTPAGSPLKDLFIKGFEYSDCCVDDSRLVILNAIDARERGAKILTRTSFVTANRHRDYWHAILRSDEGEAIKVDARIIVNAAGPWVADVNSKLKGINKQKKNALHLVKGSHVIVRKIFEGDHAYIFQNGDGRILFSIPYEDSFTLLGTTDLPFHGDLNDVEASVQEIDYILGAVGKYFQQELSRDDVISTFSGVRPLYDEATGKNASEVTRDYSFVVDKKNGVAPVLTVYGGKITTYRKLAEHALEILMPYLKCDVSRWTEKSILPGGDIPNFDFDQFVVDMKLHYPNLDGDQVLRLARAYGTRIDRILGKGSSINSLGQHFGYGLTESELRYLVTEEWAQTVDDILWRRSKLHLHLNENEKRDVENWLNSWFANKSQKVRGDSTLSLERFRG